MFHTYTTISKIVTRHVIPSVLFYRLSVLTDVSIFRNTYLHKGHITDNHFHIVIEPRSSQFPLQNRILIYRIYEPLYEPKLQSRTFFVSIASINKMTMSESVVFHWD